MKKKQLKIRAILLILLVAILGVLILLYAIFCRDGNYNSVYIPEQTTESTTVPEEKPSEQEEVADDAPEEDEAPTAPAADWTQYNPTEVLASERWMLALINKSYPLGKNYYPTTTIIIEGNSATADNRVAESYRAMYNAALKEDVVLTPFSGYCSYNRQKTLYEDKLQAFIMQGMTEEEAILNAEKRVKPAGCNESGAGLSVDVVSASAGFASTDEYKWLMANAQNYGFVLRYPEDKTEITGMIYQPWHWRYVGLDVARYMKENNLCLEEYLGLVKESES